MLLANMLVITVLSAVGPVLRGCTDVVLGCLKSRFRLYVILIFYCPQCRLDRQEWDIISLKTLVTSLSSHLALISNELAALRSSQPTTAEATTAEATGSQPSSSSSSTMLTHYPRDAQGVHRPLYSPADMPSSGRRSNLILSGLPESCKGTSRYLRTRQDLEGAGEILSSIDSLVTVNTICDCFRLGKYKENNSRPHPLLVKLTRSSDVQSILMGRKNLASRPGTKVTIGKHCTCMLQYIS